MVEKIVSFTIQAIDEASPVLDAIRAKVKDVQQTVAVDMPKATGSVTSPTVPTPTTVKPELPKIEPNTFEDFGKSVMGSLEPPSFDFSSFSAKNTAKGMGKALGDGDKQPTPKKEKSEDTTKKQDTLISTEQANLLRAMNQYRIAWLGKLPAGEGAGGVTGGMVKGAAALVILQAVSEGIQKIVQILAESSPALRAELKVLKIAIGEFLRPIGDLLSAVFRPIAMGMLQANAYARSSMAKEGIKQTDLKEYYSRFFAKSADLGLGLNMNTDELNKLVQAIQVAMQMWYDMILIGLGPIAIVAANWDTITNAGNSLKEMLEGVAGWFEKWFGMDDPGTSKDESGKLILSFTKLTNVVDMVIKPFQDLANVLDKIPGVDLLSGGGKSGGGKSSGGTLNVGGVTIINNIASSAGNIVAGAEDAVGGFFNTARGWF
jgi:hypothetical protein